MTIFTLDKKLAIEPEFDLFLKDLVINRKPNMVVEIGTGQGYSTSWILGGLNQNKKGKVLSFDSVDRSPYAWEAEGIPHERGEVVIGEFATMGDFLPAHIDLVFHDAGHWFEHVETDLALVFPRMSVGGMICVHDVVYSKEMGEKLKEFFKQRPDWRYEEILNGCGLGVAEKIR